jgi:hypothetical protein
MMPTKSSRHSCRAMRVRIGVGVAALGLLGAGCAAVPPRAPAQEGRILHVADETRVTIRHQRLHCDVPDGDAMYFLNGAPLHPSGPAHEAWIQLEPGVNQVALTRLRGGRVELLDAKIIHYEIRYSDPYALDPFGDSDGDGVLNGVFLPPKETRVRIRHPLRGQIFQ